MERQQVVFMNYALRGRTWCLSLKPSWGYLGLIAHGHILMQRRIHGHPWGFVHFYEFQPFHLQVNQNAPAARCPNAHWRWSCTDISQSLTNAPISREVVEFLGELMFPAGSGADTSQGMFWTLCCVCVPVAQWLLSLLMLISVWDKSIRVLSHHINQRFAASCLLPAGRQETHLVSLKLGARMWAGCWATHPLSTPMHKSPGSTSCVWKSFFTHVLQWESTDVSLMSLLWSQMRCTVWLKEASWVPADLQVALTYKAPNKPSLCSRPFLSLCESRAMKQFRHTVKESSWAWAGFFYFYTETF